MTILRSGTTKQYSDNWGAAFGKKAGKSKAGKSKANAVAVKKSKPAKKKKAAKKAKK